MSFRSKALDAKHAGNRNIERAAGEHVGVNTARLDVNVNTRVTFTQEG